MDKYISDLPYDTYRGILEWEAIKPRYRLLILNPDESVKGEIKGDIILGEGSYSEEYANGSRRTLSLSIYNEGNKYFSESTASELWWGKRFRFDAGVQYKQNVYWSPKGVFTPTSIGLDDSKKIQASFADKYSLIDGTTAGKLEMTHKVQRGENIYKTIYGTLAQDCGNGYPYDSKSIIIDSDLKEMSAYYTLSVDAGSSYGDIFESLREMMNASIYYNNCGNLIIANGITDLSVVRHPSQWTFADGSDCFISLGQTVKYSDKYNAVRVEGAQVDGDLYTCTIENTNPYSSLRVGLNPRVCKVITDSNIVSQKYVNDRALLELFNITLNEIDYTITSSFVPHIETGKCITVSNDGQGLSREKLLVKEVGFSVATAPQMTLNAVNIKQLPYFENYGYNIIT